jgi:hypothetical protein
MFNESRTFIYKHLQVVVIEVKQDVSRLPAVLPVPIVVKVGISIPSPL